MAQLEKEEERTVPRVRRMALGKGKVELGFKIAQEKEQTVPRVRRMALRKGEVELRFKIAQEEDLRRQ